jgi:hypothetical protein
MKNTNLLNEHLQSIEGLREVGTDDYFYTRLKAKMEKRNESAGWLFTIKPAWLIGSLILLLAVNGLLLSKQFGDKESTGVGSSSGLQGFAASYDQSISSTY